LLHEIAPHPDALRTLPGKKQCDLFGHDI
jgi:hypothetical protein